MKYRNAFVMVPPLITDSTVMTLANESYSSSVRHMLKWAMTAKGKLKQTHTSLVVLSESAELCGYIGDGILRLREGGVWQYIPDFNWTLVRDGMGPSHLYDRLVPATSTEDNSPELEADKHAILLQTVCRVLDLHMADVSVDVPLTTYGIDSLSAAALSFALRPLFAISQVQLLADISIKDLEARLDV